MDSSLKITWDHCSAVQSLWFDANSRRAFLCCNVRRCLFLGLRLLSLLRVLEIATLTPCSRGISAFISGAVLVIRHAFSDHGSVFSPRCLSLSSWNLGLSHFLSVLSPQNIARESNREKEMTKLLYLLLF